jgi:hypothetical protein
MALLGHSLEKTSDVDKGMDSFIEFQQNYRCFLGFKTSLKYFLKL